MANGKQTSGVPGECLRRTLNINTKTLEDIYKIICKSKMMCAEH
jgi:hypothetical protein